MTFQKVNEVLPNVIEFENLFLDLPSLINKINNLQWVDWTRFNGSKIGTKIEVFKNDPKSINIYNEINDACYLMLDYYTEKYNLQKNKYEVMGPEYYEILKWDYPAFGMNPHKDHSYNKEHVPHISVCIYLNNDYEGGEFGLTDHNLYFRPKANSAIMFPSDTLHEVKDLEKGNRYVITKFFTLTNS